MRRGDLLLVFVNTLWAGAGGEGTVETEWLEATLARHKDAGHKLVFGHHPVWTVNGYAGDYQRNLEREIGVRFWDILRGHGVLAYVCSHILAFDVQAREGVLQICTAGAGTAHRMPAEDEYLHIVQAALDERGLRYQVLDIDGQVREWLRWDWQIPSSDNWPIFTPQAARVLPAHCLQDLEDSYLIVWEISGYSTGFDTSRPQTILSAAAKDGALPYVWLGISGVHNQLTLLLSPKAKRSPHRWLGPSLPGDRPFKIQFAIHSGMGPGGLLWRWHDAHAWSSMVGASSWGAERLPWSANWEIGENAGGQFFRGRDLRLRWHYQSFALSDCLAKGAGV